MLLKFLKSLKEKTFGFTLAELLIVIAIIAILFVLVTMNWKRQTDRANDSRRKSDLAKIKRAFEEYYNDHECYPPPTILSNCGSGDLKPYIPEVPCDPVTKLPYKYVPLDDTNYCKGYRALTTLKDLSDPDITRLGCNAMTGCGFGASYNWGISSGTSLVASGFDPNITPTPTSAFSPGSFACTPAGTCNSYGNPGASGCPGTYADPDCKVGGIDQCQFPANRCLR